LLSAESGTQYHHVFAARQELRSLRVLRLDPEALRQPSSVNASRFLSPNRSNLPTTLARMQAEDKFALNDVSLDLANLVPDLVGLELKEDEYRNEYTIWAKYMDGRSYSSRVLSDGTLRLLALATLKNDPQFRGVLCVEEPDSGVHPEYLSKVAHLL
jgi:predicted ATPase